MKKRKNQHQDEGFFIETIDLSPSNNINPPRNDSYNTPPVPEVDTGASERIGGARFFKKLARKIKNNVLKIVACILCIYMVFLIVGAITTNYYIDKDTGTRQPVFVTYTDVANKTDYNNLKKEISQLRTILVDVRIIEIKYNNGDMDASDAASRYNQQLSKIDVIIPKLQALNVETSQASIKESLLSCYKNYLAGYLQEMYKGLTASDATAVNSALVYREYMLNTYFDSENSLKTLGEKLKLNDGFFEWELDKAAAEKDPTAVLKK